MPLLLTPSATTPLNIGRRVRLRAAGKVVTESTRSGKFARSVVGGPGGRSAPGGRLASPKAKSRGLPRNLPRRSPCRRCIAPTRGPGRTGRGSGSSVRPERDRAPALSTSGAGEAVETGAFFRVGGGLGGTRCVRGGAQPAALSHGRSLMGAPL